MIDRKLLAEDAWGGAAEPANSWISPALGVWHDKGIVDRVPGGNVAGGAEDPEGRRLRLVDGKLHYPTGVKETTGAVPVTRTAEECTPPLEGGGWEGGGWADVGASVHVSVTPREMHWIA